jgi:hypothetical protein
VTSYLDVALAREGHDFYAGSPDAAEDEELLDRRTQEFIRRHAPGFDSKALTEGGGNQPPLLAGDTHGTCAAAPSVSDDEEVPDATDLVGRPVNDPGMEPSAAGSGLGGAERQPERTGPPVRHELGDSTHSVSGPSVPPSPVWVSQFGEHVYRREAR